MRHASFDPTPLSFEEPTDAPELPSLAFEPEPSPYSEDDVVETVVHYSYAVETVVEEVVEPSFEPEFVLAGALVPSADGGTTSTPVPPRTHHDESSDIEPDIDPETVAQMAPTRSRTDLIVETSEWGYQQVRDYVIRSIEEQVGSFPRNMIKETAIFKAFCDRWGDQAVAIARAAVEHHGCWWKNSPLSVNRFCKGSDPYFAEIIAAQISRNN